MSRNMRWLTIAGVVVIALVVVSCAAPVAPAPNAASIGDLVWYDADRDGIRDAPEGGIADVPVELYGSDDTPAGSATTDEDGSYLFRGVAPGDYYVKFTLPIGYVFTEQDQGDDDSVDSDADTTTGETILITIAAGETDLTWDAGMYQFPAGPTPTPTLPMVEGPTPVPTPVTAECNDDADCLVSEQCDLTETPPVCVPLPCNDDEECPVFWGCDLTATDPVCIPLRCDDDGDCPYGACTDNLCVPLGCDDDGDCPSGACTDNLCALPCDDDEDCPYWGWPDGYVGRCVDAVCGPVPPVPCDDDADCLVAERCDLAGTPPVCIPSAGERTPAGVGCTVNQDCEDLYGPGWECKRDAYGERPAECQEAESECTDDAQCPEGLLCRSGVCAECATVEDCPVDKWCDVAQEPPVCRAYGRVTIVISGAEPGEDLWGARWPEPGPPPRWDQLGPPMCQNVNLMEEIHDDWSLTPGATVDADGSCTITLPSFTMSWWTILGRSLGDERSPSGICALRASEWYEVTEEMRRLGAQIDVPGVQPVFECIPGCAGLP